MEVKKNLLVQPGPCALVSNQASWPFFSFDLQHLTTNIFATHNPKLISSSSFERSNTYLVFFIFFPIFSSLLSSKTHITPHNSATNYFLTAHLGLKIPKTEDKNNSYLRVADQTVHWENGKLIIFDESFNHEAKVYFSHNMLEIQIYSGV